ncbi:hypothetical protein ONZ45_g17676 [Pleurotus djamor]|nr:hypothetical protein ONZ45_g17676 [Pleurotus djamor]
MQASPSPYKYPVDFALNSSSVSSLSSPLVFYLSLALSLPLENDNHDTDINTLPSSYYAPFTMIFLFSLYSPHPVALAVAYISDLRSRFDSIHRIIYLAGVASIVVASEEDSFGAVDNDEHEEKASELDFCDFRGLTNGLEYTYSSRIGIPICPCSIFHSLTDDLECTDSSPSAYTSTHSRRLSVVPDFGPRASLNNLNNHFRFYRSRGLTNGLEYTYSSLSAYTADRGTESYKGKLSLDPGFPNQERIRASGLRHPYHDHPASLRQP